MGDLFNKIMLLGMGTLALTREKAEEVVEELVKEGKIQQRERQVMVRQLIQKGEQSKKELQGHVEKTMQAVMKELDIPSRQEVNRLRAEIDALKKARGAAKKKAKK